MKSQITIDEFVVISARDIGSIVTFIRNAVRVAPKQLADSMGVSEKVLSSLESGNLEFKDIRRIFDFNRNYRIGLNQKSSK